MSGNRESLGTVLSGHRIYSEDTHGATKYVRKILTMCNEKKLYQPNEEIFSPLVKMGRGGKMTFKQIYTTTNCIRVLANKMNMPMTDVVNLLQEKKGLVFFCFRSQYHALLTCCKKDYSHLIASVRESALAVSECR